jgi:hypothetical protein
MVGTLYRKNKRKMQMPGLMKQRFFVDEIRNGKDSAASNSWRHTRQYAEQGCAKQMKRSRKSDEVLTAGAFRVKALLIRCNFWRNSVSNIADVVEGIYTTEPNWRMR